MLSCEPEICLILDDAMTMGTLRQLIIKPGVTLQPDCCAFRVGPGRLGLGRASSQGALPLTSAQGLAGQACEINQRVIANAASISCNKGVLAPQPKGWNTASDANRLQPWRCHSVTVALASMPRGRGLCL